MPATAVSIDSKRLPSLALRRFAWGVLAYFIAVILWGTLVRATGSGAGCGDHWPLCNGTVLQHSPRVDTMIEFTHRITSGISLLSVVGLLVWTFTGTVRGHLARALAVASVVFTLLEAVLGALLVKLGYTARASRRCAPLPGAAPGQHAAAAGRAHPDRAPAQPPQRLSARQRAPGRALRRGGRRAGGHGRWHYRLAGCAGRHAVSRFVTGPGPGAGLLRHQRLAGALALDASRLRHSWPASFSSGCWCAPHGTQHTGTIAASPRWCWCCWPPSTHWACSTSCCWLRCGSRSLTCSPPIRCGHRWWC